MRKAIDISNYTGRLSDEQVASLYQEGVELVIVRASLETNRAQQAIAQQQMKLLRLYGMPFWCYGWCYWDEDPRQTVDAWANLIAQYLDGYYHDPQHGRIFWLDCEDQRHKERAVGWLHEALARAAERFAPLGVRCGIYTGPWWWGKDGLGDPQDFAHLPLWYAEYGVEPGSYNHPIGGWERPLLHQYQGTTNLGLVQNVDLNVLLDVPVPEGEIPPMLAHLDAVWGWLNAAEQACRLKDARTAIQRAREELIQVKQAAGFE